MKKKNKISRSHSSHRARGSLTGAIIEHLKPFRLAENRALHAGDLAASLGVDTREITGILARLAKQGRIDRTDNGWGWVYATASQRPATSNGAEPALAFV